MRDELLYLRQRRARRGGNPLAGVSKDATRNVYAPANATEWSAILAAAGIATGGPSYLHLCQEASGNLADSIGSLTLTAAGSPGYQQSVAGWSRKAVTMANGSIVDKFSAASGQGPNVATESVLWLAYVSLPTIPAATSSCGGPSTYPNGRSVSLSTTGKLVSYVRNVNVNSTNTHTGLGVVPLILQYDRTNSTAITFSQIEKVTNTYVGTAADGEKGLGALIGLASAAQSVLYVAWFKGAAAELTTTQIKTLLQTLGWSPSWTP